MEIKLSYVHYLVYKFKLGKFINYLPSLKALLLSFQSILLMNRKSLLTGAILQNEGFLILKAHTFNLNRPWGIKTAVNINFDR
jgi:hypothetical protein